LIEQLLAKKSFVFSLRMIDEIALALVQISTLLVLGSMLSQLPRCLGINKYFRSFRSAKSGAMFLSLDDKIAVNAFEGLM
jgi:hypothetical protein